MKASFSLSAVAFFLGAVASAWFSRHGWLPAETFVLGAGIVAAAWFGNVFGNRRRRPRQRPQLQAVKASSRPSSPAPAAASIIERDLTSALVNFGARKPAARSAARAAILAHPTADLVTLVRLTTVRLAA